MHDPRSFAERDVGDVRDHAEAVHVVTADAKS
jgi:hypothetical protein